MMQGFFQFNNSAVNEIEDFIVSSYNIFFLSGSKGTSKDEIIEKAILKLSENNLIFRHFCFENSVINDFLLNFYDSFRNYSLAGKVSLKKFTTDDFKEKVSHYFKTIDKKCIIIVENYEKVELNKEIADFLTHLSMFENVKIIIVSANKNKILHSIGIQSFEIEPISKDDFKSKLAILEQSLDNDIKEKFYDIAQGNELYLNMSIKYCSNTGITIPDLINEYERRTDNFEHFIILKLITLTPSNCRVFFNMLSVLSHPISVKFIENYKLGNVGYIDYLSKNLLISKFGEEIYIKDYFKNYIKENFTIQEKVSYYSNFVKIFENELTKSPKDRLLRLSRESIRKEIEIFNSMIPSINSQSQKAFSYIGMSNFDFSDEKTKQKNILSEKFNKIKERKYKISEKEKEILAAKRLEESGQISLVNQNKEKNREFIIDLINEARNLSQNYQYKEANQILLRALTVDYDSEFKIELCTLIAKNYDLLNEYNNAYNYYEEAKTCAVNANDSRACEIQCLIALLNKKLYKTDIAKEQFAKLVANERYSDKYRAIASIELGEIEESQGNIENAAKNYENALSLTLGTNKELSAKSYYRLAVLYDESGDIDNAVKYYKKNYTLSSQHSENAYYSISLTNLASIYIEQSNYREASEFLKLALVYDSENNDLENMYYAQKELAKLYARFDSKNAFGYFKQALDSANKMQDSFKAALVYFEAGEFYYDKEDDKQALENFFKAKKTLGNDLNDENVIRINSRIQDIKMRLNSAEFNSVAEKFND